MGQEKVPLMSYRFSISHERYFFMGTRFHYPAEVEGISNNEILVTLGI